jgi:hypothetical protein
MAQNQTSLILAMDPGKDKCGIAIAAWEDGGCRLLHRRIVPAGDVERTLPALVKEFKIEELVLGDATTSRAWFGRLEPLLPEVKISLVREAGSTLEARGHYWRAHPPRGWRRMLPLSLQMPPEPIDDFAAVVLAERFFGEK